ncbi:glycosyltransferase family 39 protein [Amycolatopsis sp. NPDC102389]|uniref:glycosyltransferase family 39 protein n=1 Tax=Amycolatopsis sp. NPDC102389 TaxID=3363941 RepID=UPI00382C9357
MERFARGPVGLVVAIQVLVLTLLSGRYGFHRDELYFLAAGKRLAWGYVDQPPLTPLLARLSTDVFGATPAGLRVAATVCAAATVVLLTLVAREFGGGRGAQVLTAAMTALAAFVVVDGHMLSTATVDLLIWSALGLVVLRLLRTGDGRWWLAVGAVVGIGLEGKWLVLLMVASIGLAVLAVGPRTVFRSGWLAAGILLALVLAAPGLIWQAAHDFPLLTVASGISDEDGAENRILFVPMQLLYLSPVVVPVWVAGALRLWRDPDLRWARSLTPAYLVLCVILLVLGGKPYYSAPFLLLLAAAGAEPCLRSLDRVSRRVGAAVMAVLGAAVSLVVGLPLLPVSVLAPILVVNKEQGEQSGWPELASTVTRVWEQIPPEQRSTAVIFTRNYGQAGALEHYGLPSVYSGHMSYADWGPPPSDAVGPVVVVGPYLPDWFTGCREAAVHDNGLGVENDEQGVRISLCTGTSRPWSALWGELRHYY